MAPFDLLDYDDPDLLERWAGLEPKWNAYVELHNLIAAAEGPREFGPESRKQISRTYGVDLAVAFEEERRALYARYLDHCLEDGALTAEERDRLGHLARTLALGVHDLEPIHVEAYGRTVSDALTDDCLDVEERLLLYTMQHTLGLDPDHTKAVYDEAARTTLLKRVAEALCDGELSDAEAAALDVLADEIGVEIPPGVRSMMERAAYRWEIRHGHGDLQGRDLSLRLVGDEVGHFEGVGTWFEVNYSRLRIERPGYRSEMHTHQTWHITMPKEAIKRLDSGSVFVTDQRLVLSGKRLQPRVLKFSSLLGAEQYQNGVRVIKKGARSLFFQLEGDSDLLYLVLSRLLKQRWD